MESSGFLIGMVLDAMVSAVGFRWHGFVCRIACVGHAIIYIEDNTIQ